MAVFSRCSWVVAVMVLLLCFTAHGYACSVQPAIVGFRGATLASVGHAVEVVDAVYSRWLAVDVAVVLVLVGGGRGAGDVAGPRSAGDGAERRGGDGAGWCWVVLGGAGWCWAGLDNSSGLAAVATIDLPSLAGTISELPPLVPQLPSFPAATLPPAWFHRASPQQHLPTLLSPILLP
ncbi:hypothetical protein FPQ18DRAFT_301743 [Pyronema domesticum]|nr:hypothetical protein FPQ18DRAFT_301743 [Pyronema domesticum]